MKFAIIFVAINTAGIVIHVAITSTNLGMMNDAS